MFVCVSVSVYHARQAFVALVRRERVAAERQRKEEEEERKRKKEEQQRHNRLLEASFDGVLKEILAVLREVRSRRGPARRSHELIAW